MKRIDTLYCRNCKHSAPLATARQHNIDDNSHCPVCNCDSLDLLGIYDGEKNYIDSNTGEITTLHDLVSFYVDNEEALISDGYDSTGEWIDSMLFDMTLREIDLSRYMHFD